MQKQFNYKNTNISFAEYGKGTCLVFLHGFLENKEMWNYFVPFFSEKHKVITIDLLGHGKSENLGYIHTMEDQADMVYALLQDLKIKNAIFIGHSMGGYVALAFAEMYTEKIKGLVLLNSTSRADSTERKENRDRAILAVKQNFAACIKMSIANLFSPENRTVLKNEIEQVKAEALKTSLQGIVAAQEGMKIRKDREVILHFATYPILLILGKKDPVLNYEETITQIETTKVNLVTFEDGHMSHIENKKELLNQLQIFLKSI
ncbi:MAG: alpha/beta hydrolase [Ottowia sp.]